MSELGPNHGKRTMRSYFRFRFGDIAQLVEQMTFNHWVQGSSPCVPTRNSTVASRPFNFGLGTQDKNQEGFVCKVGTSKPCVVCVVQVESPPATCG